MMTAEKDTPNFDVQATVDAVNLISSTRVNHSPEIPMVAWKMMAHAEEKLNKELHEYLVPIDK